MSTHPNCLLIGALIPDDLPSKTFRSVLAELGLDDGDDLEISDKNFHVKLMDGDYDDDMQVTAPSGATVFIGMLTYGYGEVMPWDKLVEVRDALLAKLTEIAAATHCRVEITVSANYW